MKLIVGLGNPDKKYDKTRHNVGFMVIDNYTGSNGYSSKFNALYKEVNINGEKVLFIKPQTYMNNSGESVIKFVNYYNIDLCDILVVQDDIDLNMGKFRVKFNSSDGGHNGIKSIINCLGSKEFARLKIGVRNEKLTNAIDFVLGKFSGEELDIIDNNMNVFKSIIDDFIIEDIDKVMNKYNWK